MSAQKYRELQEKRALLGVVAYNRSRNRQDRLYGFTSSYIYNCLCWAVFGRPS